MSCKDCNMRPFDNGEYECTCDQSEFVEQEQEKDEKPSLGSIVEELQNDMELMKLEHKTEMDKLKEQMKQLVNIFSKANKTPKSSSINGDNKKVGFGKHKDLTYLDLKAQHPNYKIWMNKQAESSIPAFNELKEYLNKM